MPLTKEFRETILEDLADHQLAVAVPNTLARVRPNSTSAILEVDPADLDLKAQIENSAASPPSKSGPSVPCRPVGSGAVPSRPLSRANDWLAVRELQDGSGHALTTQEAG